MATDLLTPGAWRFAGDNPFIRYDTYYGPGGLLQGYDPSQGPVYGMGGDNPALFNPERRDAWMASDSLLATDPELFGNQTNLEVVSQDENGYTVKRKTGDKEGTLIRIERDPSTGEWTNVGPVGTQRWDTNEANRNTLRGLGSVIAAPFLVGGAQQLGLIGQGTMGFPVGVGELASFGPEFVGLGTPGILTPGISEATLNTLSQLGVGGAESGGGALASADAAAINAAGLTDAAPWLSQVGYGGAPPNSGPPAPPGTPATQPGTNPASAASGTTGLLDKIKTGGLGALDLADWAKIVGPIAGGIGSFIDAKNKDGQSTGYGPSTDFLTQQMSRQPMGNRQQIADFVSQGPQFNPQFTTGLLNLPPAGQRTGYNMGLLGRRV